MTRDKALQVLNEGPRFNRCRFPAENTEILHCLEKQGYVEVRGVGFPELHYYEAGSYGREEYFAVVSKVVYTEIVSMHQLGGYGRNHEVNVRYHQVLLPGAACFPEGMCDDTALAQRGTRTADCSYTRFSISVSGGESPHWWCMNRWWLPGSSR